MLFSEATFDDHSLVTIELFSSPVVNSTFVTRRDWSNYNIQAVNTQLTYELNLISNIDFNTMNVCESWNVIENAMIKTIDACAPLKKFTFNSKLKNSEIPRNVKTKITKRKKLLKLNKTDPTRAHAPEIKVLNKEINYFFHDRRASKVRRAAFGVKVNIWKAVNIAKNLCHTDIPKNMSLGAPPSHLLMSSVALPHSLVPRFKSIPIEQKSQITSIMANVN